MSTRISGGNTYIDPGDGGRPGRRRRVPRAALVVTPVALVAAIGVAAVLAGGTPSPTGRPASSVYGSGSVGGAGPPPSSAAPPTAGTGAVASGQTSLGKVVTDGRGMTVYLFEDDSGIRSTCYGACAQVWPPVTTTVAAPMAGSGAAQSLLGTADRTDGTRQLTYAGHPLYYFAGDQKPGDTKGEGLTSFGGGWDALTPSGQKIEGGS